MADEPIPPVLAQDLRGWFYRAIAPEATSAVLEVGEAHLRNWFPDVTSRDLKTADRPFSDSEQFDIVVIHRSLGGCATLHSAIVSARSELRHGGILALWGENRLRRRARSEVSPICPPRATGWGFRAALKRAGFADVSLYVTHPPTREPIYVVDTHRRSARAFFRGQMAAQALPRWSIKSLVVDALVTTNLMPYLLPGFIVVGRKC